MPRPKLHPQPSASPASWLGAFGLSSGAHVVGLVALPTLLGWGWWEWRRPAQGGLSEPVAVRFEVAAATRPAPQAAPDVTTEETPLSDPVLDLWSALDLEDTALAEAAFPEEEAGPEEEARSPEAHESPPTPQPLPADPLAGVAWQQTLAKTPAGSEDPSADASSSQPEPAIAEFVEPEPQSVPAAEWPDPGEPVEVHWEPTPQSQYCPEPAYPTKYQRRRMQGTVVLAMTVEPGGQVQEVRVLESSGHGSLDELARKTLATWRFEPGPEGAKAKVVQRRVQFRLP